MRELEGKTVLVTGGTGSFGNRVAAHISRMLSAAEVRILSRDEKKQWEMSRHFPEFRYIIADVRDLSSLTRAMNGVDFVFHAAALKQVPTCELHPYEAVKTNVLGSGNVCEAAVAAGVEVVIALSTDKAVKPVNAMGMTKATMEKLVSAQNLMQSDTTFACVRYGNVIGTRGSVVPLFRDLIDEGRPLTVTVPSMTRFLLTIQQSVDLVLHALGDAEGGEIYVKKAPASSAMDLARAIGRKFSPLGENHEIVETGIRPGEKIDEVLVSEYEMQRAIETPDFFKICPEYRREGVVPRRPTGAEYTSRNTTQLSVSEIVELLAAAELVANFR